MYMCSSWPSLVDPMHQFEHWTATAEVCTLGWIRHTVCALHHATPVPAFSPHHRLKIEPHLTLLVFASTFCFSFCITYIYIYACSSIAIIFRTGNTFSTSSCFSSTSFFVLTSTFCFSFCITSWIVRWRCSPRRSSSCNRIHNFSLPFSHLRTFVSGLWYTCSVGFKDFRFFVQEFFSDGGAARAVVLLATEFIISHCHSLICALSFRVCGIPVVWASKISGFLFKNFFLMAVQPAP